jgi:hypothetical protein
MQNPKTGRLSDRAFRLFVGLITTGDDEGRLVWDAEDYLLRVFGYHHHEVTTDKVEDALQEILVRALARRYSVDGQDHLVLCGWK